MSTTQWDAETRREVDAIVYDDRWTGLALTGGVLMMIMGSFRAITGFIGLFNDEWVLRGFNAYYFIDISAAAWWMFILGSLVALAGLGVLAGQTWARVVGVIAVSLAALSELFWMPIYPIWSLAMLAMYTLIVTALIAWKPVRN